MKNLSILLLFLFTICSSQKKISDKKYFDTEKTFQKYHNIKKKFDSLIKINKDLLIYRDGIYFLKRFPKEKFQENNGELAGSIKSKLLLNDGENIYFVKDEGLSETIFMFDDKKLVKRITLDKKRNTIDYIDNVAESIAVRYDVDNNRIYLSHYFQDKADIGKREIILEQEYYNNHLVLTRNYKKDFKTSQKEMLKKLPDNFYKAAQKYLEKQCLEETSSLESCKIKSKRISMLKEDLEMAIINKNDLYKEMRIHRSYNENNYPLYEIYIQDQSELWEIKIDGKTNIVLSIDYELLKA